MKKIITFIIIATLTLSCLMNINVGAEETFGKAEAEALLIEAYQRYMLTQNCEICAEDQYLKDDYIEKEYTGPRIPLSDSGEWEYALSSKGIPYKSGSPLFTPVQDPRFDTMEKCYSYMGEVFTEDWAKLIIDVHRNSSPQNIRETFRTSKGGLICYYDPEEKPPVVPFEQDPNWKHIKVVYNFGETGIGDMWRQLKSIGDFHLNGDTATLDVVFACVNPENALQWEYHDKEVTFEKTSAGWRVSGGSFFEAMHLYNFNGQNPFDHELTQKQAEELLIAAYHRWFMFQWGDTGALGDVLKSEGGFLEQDSIAVDADLQARTLFEKKGDGSSYKYASTPTKLDYVPIIDPRFDTLGKCYDYVEEAFTEEWAYKILNLHWYRGSYGNGEQYEVVRLSDGGKLQNKDGSYTDWEDGVLMILFGHGGGETMMHLEEIGELTVSGNTAKIAVTARIREQRRYSDVPDGSIDCYPGHGLEGPMHDGSESVFLVPYDMYVNFEYTENGWRVSGGDFFDTIMNRWGESNKTPDTSDSTFETTPETVPETEPETVPETEPETAPETTPIVHAPVTQVPATQAPTAQTPAEQNSGCGSVIGGGFAVIAIVSLAGVAFKKKQ